MNNAKKTTKEPRAKWTAFHDRIFADAMVGQIHNGRTTHNGFSKAAWRQIKTEFNEKTGCNYTLDQMRNRLFLLKIQYRTVKGLIKLSGFGWDETRHVVTAKADEWQAYVKDHPNVEQFRTQGFPIYDQMHIICEESTAHGKNDASQEYVSLEVDTPGTMQHTQHMMQERSAHEPTTEDAQSTGDMTNTPLVSNKRRSETPSTSRSRRRSVANDMADAIYDLADASRSRTVAMRPVEDPYSLNKCVQALGEIEGITDEMFVRGCNVLKDPSNREIFLSMGANLRLRWLHFLVSGDV